MAVNFNQKMLDQMIQDAINWQPPDMTQPVVSPQQSLSGVLEAARKQNRG